MTRVYIKSLLLFFVPFITMIAVWPFLSQPYAFLRPSCAIITIRVTVVPLEFVSVVQPIFP